MMTGRASKSRCALQWRRLIPSAWRRSSSPRSVLISRWRSWMRRVCSALHTEVMKTEALKQALDRHGFDAAIGGARRDEEKSRAKERVFSVRGSGHVWQPRRQRPELWRLYNTRLGPGESMRVFPLSNWTEIDVWDYIELEGIDIVPLYFAKQRPVVVRDGVWIVLDDDRLPLLPGERPEMRKVRF